MGPRSFRPRNRNRFPRNGPPIASFNGAAVFQTAESLHDLPGEQRHLRFNGAAVFQTAESFVAPLRYIPGIRFNGAAVFQTAE